MGMEPLVIYSATQYVFRDRRQIARVVGLPINRIRCVNSTMGGGFRPQGRHYRRNHSGAADHGDRPTCPAVLLPARIDAHPDPSPPDVTRVRTGATRDGRLTAMEGVTYGDTGAYSSLGIYIIKKIALHLGGPYFFPNYKADSFSVYTNNPISGPFRGFGVFQAAIVHEAQMDELAIPTGHGPTRIPIEKLPPSWADNRTGQVVTEGCGTSGLARTLAGVYARKAPQLYHQPQVIP